MLIFRTMTIITRREYPCHVKEKDGRRVKEAG